jgi:regulator of replication initiation timing
MKFFNREPFDDQKVESIRVQITNMEATGSPVDYQVVLDDMEVIPRTSNADLFTSFYDLINENSRNLNIHVYSGTSRHKRTYSFYFSNAPTKGGELNGFDAQQMVDYQVSIETMKMKLNFSEQQIKQYQDTIDELEAENEKLESENTGLRDDLKKALSENGIASTVIQGVERVITQLAPQRSNGALAGTPAQNTPKHGTVSITAEQNADYQAFSALANRFEPSEFDNVLSVLGILAEDKSTIAETLEFLKQSNNE